MGAGVALDIQVMPGLSVFGGGAWKTEGVRPSGGISNYFIGKTPDDAQGSMPLNSTEEP